MGHMFQHRGLVLLRVYEADSQQHTDCCVAVGLTYCECLHEPTQWRTALGRPLHGVHTPGPAALLGMSVCSTNHGSASDLTVCSSVCIDAIGMSDGPWHCSRVYSGVDSAGAGLDCRLSLILASR